MVNKKEEQISVSLINMSNVYQQQQNWMQFLNYEVNHYTWIDASDVTGTDCYCDDLALQHLTELLAKISAYGIHYIDGGNYHYLSKLFTDKLSQPFDFIVLDHHHDMQPPLFGSILSCGGWLKEVLDNNTFLNQVVVIGVQDELITKELKDSYPQVQFITENEIEDLKKGLSMNKDQVNGELSNKIANYIFSKIKVQYPVYLSIDKDVLSEKQYKTNWNQGVLSVQCLKEMVLLLLDQYQVLGVDICGEMDAATQKQYGYLWNETNGQVNIDLLQLFLSSKMKHL